MTPLIREAVPLALASTDDRIVAGAVFVAGFMLGLAVAAALLRGRLARNSAGTHVIDTPGLADGYDPPSASLRVTRMNGGDA